MEAQLHRHHHEEDPHSTGLHSGGGEGEQHNGEKKSVLKKVKDKAKKIKDTIKKHGHGHDHEGGHRRTDIYQQGFQEEDDDDEVDSSPEVHGAPIYESSAKRSSNIPRDSIANLEKPTDRYKHNVGVEGIVPGRRPTPQNTIALPKIDRRAGLDEDPQAPSSSPANVLPSNYQSRVTDPAGGGGKEADVAPLVHQLGNVNVGDPDAPGRRVQFASQPTLMQKQFNPESEPENTGLNSEGQDSVSTGGMSMNTIAGKAGETLAPVYDKVAGTGSAVLSKVYGMVGGENEGGESMKEYLSEKFRPGDEDKALSEVITNALHKKEPGQGQEKKLGKVTMSKEVEARLGGVEDSKREGKDAVAAGRESTGQGVVERLTDAVGLWLGKSEGIQTAKDSVGQSYVSDAASGGNKVGE